MKNQSPPTKSPELIIVVSPGETKRDGSGQITKRGLEQVVNSCKMIQPLLRNKTTQLNAYAEARDSEMIYRHFLNQGFIERSFLAGNGKVSRYKIGKTLKIIKRADADSILMIMNPRLIHTAVKAICRSFLHRNVPVKRIGRGHFVAIDCRHQIIATA